MYFIMQNSRSLKEAFDLNIFLHLFPFFVKFNLFKLFKNYY